MRRSFKRQLEQSVLASVIVIVAGGMLLFFVGLMLSSYWTVQQKALRLAEQLSSVYYAVTTQVGGFVMDENLHRAAAEDSEQANGNSAALLFKQYFAQNRLSGSLVVCDSEGEMLQTTLPEQAQTVLLREFQKIICQNAAKQGAMPYQTVFSQAERQQYVLTTPIRAQNGRAAYLSIYLDGDSIGNRLVERQMDAAITDARGNVLFTTFSGFVSRSNKLLADRDGVFWLEGERYRVVCRPSQKRDVFFYIFLYEANDSTVLLYGLLIFVLMGGAWYSIVRGMTHYMAQKQAAAILGLTTQIKAIRRAPSRRISVQQQDEYGQVGREINRMLDHIDALNQKNATLDRLNNQMEISRLTAQFNPHFLYNTLETIRYTLYAAPKLADELILQLTRLLRYSIDSSAQDVPLAQDMKYIRDYLDIQLLRHDGRLQVDIDLAPECDACIIPKLLLQPILENALKYGFCKKEHLSLQIKGRLVPQGLRLWVSDDGGAVDNERLCAMQAILDGSTQGAHHGLLIMQRRLRLQYGGGSGMLLAQNEAQGLTVCLTIAQKMQQGRGGNVSCDCG